MVNKGNKKNTFIINLWIALLLVILKIAGVLSLPWLWVLCPIWLPFAVILVGFLLACCFVLVIIIIKFIIESINILIKNG